MRRLRIIAFLILIFSGFFLHLESAGATEPSSSSQRLSQRLQFALSMISETDPSGLEFSQTSEILFQLRERLASFQTQTCSDGSDAEVASAPSARTGSDDDGDWQVPFDVLTPGIKSRFFRSANVSFSFLDQPDNIFAGVTEDSPVDPIFIENPDEILLKLDLSFNPGRIFTSPDDFSAAYTVAAEDTTKALVDITEDPLNDLEDPREKLAFLAWSKKRGLGKRLASVFNFSLAASERSSLAGTEIVPSPVRDRDGTAFTFVAKFDFDRLIIFPGDLAKAYATLNNHTSLSNANVSGLRDLECDDDVPTPLDCLRHLSDIKIRDRWVAAIIPTVEVRTIDEFDFISVGGSFVTNSLLENSLEQVKVMWDLDQALDTAKHRREAIKAIALHQKLRDRDEKRAATLTFTSPGSLVLTEGDFLHLPLQVEYFSNQHREKASDVSWVLEDGAGLTLSPEGVLTGYPPPGQRMVTIVALDKHGNRARQEIELKVRCRPGAVARQELLLLYADLLDDPDLILQDDWFQDFRDAWHVVLRSGYHGHSIPWSLAWKIPKPSRPSGTD